MGTVFQAPYPGNHFKVSTVKNGARHHKSRGLSDSILKKLPQVYSWQISSLFVNSEMYKNTSSFNQAYFKFVFT